jgi:hypothetical protein
MTRKKVLWKIDANIPAFHDKEKSLMENGCEHSSFSQHGKKVLWKIYAKTLAFHDKE